MVRSLDYPVGAGANPWACGRSIRPPEQSESIKMKTVKWVINPAALRMCYSLNEVVTLPDSLADSLLDSGAVELVSEELATETATAKVKPETATAKPQRKK